MENISNKIDKFNSIIVFIISLFTSRQMAFIYCVIGTFGQVAHTYYLSASISSYTGFFQGFQATLLSIFISSSLLYFVAVADKDDVEVYKKNLFTINILMIIEILINFYYYAKHLIIDSPEMRVFDFIFSILISCLIPVVIKLFASHIRAKDLIKTFFASQQKTNEVESNEFNDKNAETLSIIDDKIDETLSKIIEIDEKLTNEISTIKEDIALNDTKLLGINEAFEKRIADILIDFSQKIGAFENSNDVEQTTNIDEQISTIVKDELSKFMQEIDEKVAGIFAKQQDKFINQAQNKLKLMMSNVQNNNNIVG